MKLELTEKPKKVKEVMVEMTKEELSHQYKHALEHFGAEVQAPGFRKGKAPLDVVKQKVDKSKVDGHVLNHIYPEIMKKVIEEHKIAPIMHPRMKLDHLSQEEGFKAIITFVERPDIGLPEYKKIASKSQEEVKKNKSEGSKIITAKNIEDAKKKAAEGVKEANEKIKDAAKANELTEDQKILSAIYEKLIEEVKIDLADIMVEEETTRLIQNFLSYLSRLGINAQDYLKQQNTTIERVREDYKQQAIKNLKLEFILGEISKKENIKVESQEIEDVIKNVPGEDQKKFLSQPEQKIYIESTLLKNKVANKLVEWAKGERVYKN